MEYWQHITDIYKALQGTNSEPSETINLDNIEYLEESLVKALIWCERVRNDEKNS